MSTLNLSADLLTPHQLAVAARALQQESEKRRHLVVSLSGAHAYGFPSPDSDLDLKGIHIAPTRQLVRLTPPDTHADRVEVIEGVEIDYTSNEIGPVLQGILKGNGNYAERVLGALLPVTSAELQSLAPIVSRALSQRMFAHYQGFARSQQAAVDDATRATAKKVLYVLRTTLTGSHLLETGRIQTNVTALLDDYGFSDARELIAIKSTGERTPLDEATLRRWRARLTDAFAKLSTARDRSPLPDAPANVAEVESWLIQLRRESFG